MGYEFVSIPTTPAMTLESVTRAEKYEASAYYGEIYVVSSILILFSVVGTAGNGLVLYVFSRKKDSLVSTQFIIALATVDFVTCSLLIPCTIYMESRNFHISNDFFCKLYQFLIASSIPFSALIMVAIAVDRYLCICHPFVKVLTVGRSKVMICLLWLVAGLMGVFAALVFSVYEIKEVKVKHHTENIVLRPVNPDFLNFSKASTPKHSVVKSSQDDGADGFDDPYIKHTVHYELFNSELCQESALILSNEFFYYYQKIYNMIFPLCLITVAILYVLIYRSIVVRRNRRQKQKSKALPLIQSNKSPSKDTPNTDSTSSKNGTTKKPDSPQNLTPEYGANQPGKENEDDKKRASIDQSSTKASSEKNSKSCKSSENEEKKRTAADKMRMANIKTAAMLFVVTVVFVVSFFPAYLVTIGAISFIRTLFYLYFAMNVANPVIYSFMNKNFRADLAKLFGR